MRRRHDDARRDPDGGPERSCILTREAGPPAGLVRLALAPDGAVLPDVRGRAPGRGAWIGVDRTALDAANANGKLRGALLRAFKGATLSVPADLGAMIAAALERSALDRLGLESRSGTLMTGTDRIATAARGGQLRLLLHAADAAPDGMSRLAQAWRVGSDREGTGLKGLVLPVGRTILSLALGRENVVHVGLVDASAAKRVSETLLRWRHFIGPDPAPDPCARADAGPSAANTPAHPREEHPRAAIGPAEELKRGA